MTEEPASVFVARLCEIVRLCRMAEAMANRGRDWYESDPELGVPKLAAESIVLKLGEAVRRLPEEFLKARQGDAAWRRAIGMRNRIAHEYDAVDYEIVWRVLSTGAPQLRGAIEEILSEAGSK